MAQPKAPLRFLYGAFGLLCAVVGILGIVLPVMPGFVFLLIALWSFRHSSPKMEAWLLNNRRVGPMLRDWEANRSMKLSTKIIVLLAIWGSFAITCWRILSAQKIGEIPFSPGMLAGIKYTGVGLLITTVTWLTHMIWHLPTAPGANLKKMP